MKFHVEYKGRVCDYEIQPTTIIGAVSIAAIKIIGIPALVAVSVLIVLYGVYKSI